MHWRHKCDVSKQHKIENYQHGLPRFLSTRLTIHSPSTLSVILHLTNWLMVAEAAARHFDTWQILGKWMMGCEYMVNPPRASWMEEVDWLLYFTLQVSWAQRGCSDISTSRVIDPLHMNELPGVSLLNVRRTHSGGCGKFCGSALRFCPAATELAVFCNSTSSHC